MSTIAEPYKHTRDTHGLHSVDPFNHYEVECNKQTTLFIGEEFRDADAVFNKTTGPHSPKALIHVKGHARIVLKTNAPYMYLVEKIDRKEIVSSCPHDLML